MNIIKAFYHGVSKKTAAYKIAVVIFLCMFFNMLNMAAVVDIKTLDLHQSVLQLENELGRIYNAINIPIKIVDDLFKKERALFENNKDSGKKDNTVYAVTSPSKQTKKNFIISKNSIAMPNTNEVEPIMRSILNNSPPGYTALKNYVKNNEHIRMILILLMIMFVLPRGIPGKIKIKTKINNIGNACPAL